MANSWVCRQRALKTVHYVKVVQTVISHHSQRQRIGAIWIVGEPITLRFQ